MKKAIFGLMLTLLLIGIVDSAFNIRRVESSEAPETEWSRTYGGTKNDVAHSVVETDDGGYAIAGYTESFGAGGADFWLIKTDSLGNILWNQTYGGTSDDAAQEVVQTSDGGYAVVGYTASFGAGWRDVLLVITDSAGNMLSPYKTWGGTGEEMGRGLIKTGDGGYAIAAFTISYGAGNKDFWLIKTDIAGILEWDRTYGGGSEDQAFSLVETEDGGYALTDYTASYGTGSWDFWLVKTDINGNKEWDQTYGGTDLDQALSMVQTEDGGYAVTGFTNSFGAGASDFWLIKVKPSKISATVDIDPNTLNLKSNGQWITAYVTLPEGYNVEDIVSETVYLDGILAEWSEIQNGVYMAKFYRATVQASVTTEPDYESAPKFYDLQLTVTGELVDGTPFKGSDTITVIKK